MFSFCNTLAMLTGIYLLVGFKPIPNNSPVKIQYTSTYNYSNFMRSLWLEPQQCYMNRKVLAWPVNVNNFWNANIKH